MSGTKGRAKPVRGCRDGNKERWEALPAGKGFSLCLPNLPSRAVREKKGPYMPRCIYGPYADDCRLSVQLTALSRRNFSLSILLRA